MNWDPLLLGENMVGKREIENEGLNPSKRRLRKVRRERERN